MNNWEDYNTTDIDNLLFLLYNKSMETKIEQKVAGSKNIAPQIECGVLSKQKPIKKTLTPYKKYKNSRNQNGKKYFDFYDDIKVYTHNIYDW